MNHLGGKVVLIGVVTLIRRIEPTRLSWSAEPYRLIVLIEQKELDVIGLSSPNDWATQDRWSVGTNWGWGSVGWLIG